MRGKLIEWVQEISQVTFDELLCWVNGNCQAIAFGA